ncbi:MAG: hypothetical protein IKN57_04165 [Parasporobacterium sp.]|nr:hypothetical protein [Parasporobacterium sp.]
MNNSSFVLLRTLLLSSSQRNIYRHCKDKKKRGRIAGNAIGFVFIYLMLIAYCILMCIGYGQLGLTQMIPALCALTISALAFCLTLFKTNGYLFNFKEYDMLMSLPFEAKTIAGCKFLCMYIKSLPWNMSISVSMLIGYGIYAKPSFLAYLLWAVLSLFLPVIPMLAASFIGFLIAKISAGFRKKNIIQTILTFAFIILCFASRYVIEGLIKNDQIDETLEAVSVSVNKIVNIYLPAAWFEDAVECLSLSDCLLLAGVTVFLFEIIFIPVGRSYRRINSKLKSHAASKNFSMTGQRQRSVLNAIAFKELKRMTGSTVYMTNAGVGELLALILGIAVLFVDMDKLLYTALQGAPVTKEMLYPAIPFISCFFISIVATTAITPSLEGKNYWIVQSLPIPKKRLYQGKMLFNLYLTVPFSLFATVCLCISSKIPLLTGLLSICQTFCLCAFSTAWGCVCGIRHMRLDWENEVEVIKQGAAVTVYLFPNMFGTMGAAILSVFLGTKMDRNLVLGIMILTTAALAMICYRKAMRLAEK